MTGNKKLLIGCGAVGCLGLIVLVIALFALGYVGSRMANKNTQPGPRPSNGANVATETFVNSRDGLTGSLAQNYVDFSFQYPSSWKLDREGAKPGGSNFVKVEETEPGVEMTRENFAVGYFTGSLVVAPMLAEQLNTQFAKGFPDYKKVSEGKTRVGSYDGYEFRFTASVKDTPKGNLDIWGRTVLIPGSGSQKGAALIMLASSLDPDVDGPEDVGEKGDLPVILNSFRLGAGTAANGSGGYNAVSSLSERDKHRLFQAAATTNDDSLVKEALNKLGFSTDDAGTTAAYERFLEEHQKWATEDYQWINSHKDPQTARRYAEENLR